MKSRCSSAHAARSSLFPCCSLLPEMLFANGPQITNYKLCRLAAARGDRSLVAIAIFSNSPRPWVLQLLQIGGRALSLDHILWIAFLSDG